MDGRTGLALGMGMLVAGCYPYGAETKSISGPYKMVAIDTAEQSEVAYDLGHGSSIGRVPPTVFAVGYNRDYIVAARHPTSYIDQPDRSKTEYYYIIRAKDGPYVDPSVTVRGPFNASGFAAETGRLHLPTLKDEIASLK